MGAMRVLFVIETRFLFTFRMAYYIMQIMMTYKWRVGTLGVMGTLEPIVGATRVLTPCVSGVHKVLFNAHVASRCHMVAVAMRRRRILSYGSLRATVISRPGTFQVVQSPRMSGVVNTRSSVFEEGADRLNICFGVPLGHCVS